MKISQEKIEFSKSLLITYVTSKLSLGNNISTEAALSNFMLTKTYDLLQDAQSRLWAESPEYVLDMLESELENDIEEWLKI